MLLVVFTTALISSLLFTPAARKFALKFDIVDHPDRVVKTHNKVTPYLGGSVIFVSFLLTVFSINLLNQVQLYNSHIGIFVGSFIVVCLGLIDDIKAIGPKAKLTGQIVAGTIVELFGVKTNLFGIELLDWIFTLVWVVGLSNAFNLIDIMDGLSSGVAMIASAFLAIILSSSGDQVLPIFLLALAGGCLGFLKYNFNPAKIFLGDSGSLFLGFILACICIEPFWQKGFDLKSIVPIMVFTTPIFETIFISILRIRAGKSPLMSSKDHFALRIVYSGITIKKTVLITYFVGVIVGIVALISYQYVSIILYMFSTLLAITIYIAKKLSLIDINNY